MGRLIAMKAYSDGIPTFQFPELAAMDNQYRMLAKIKSMALSLVEETKKYYEKERELFIPLSTVANDERINDKFNKSHLYEEEIEICDNAIESGSFKIFWHSEKGEEEILFY